MTSSRFLRCAPPGAVALLLVLLTTSGVLRAQATTVYTEAWRTFKQAEDHQQQNVLAKAQREYAEVVEMLLPAHQPEAALLRTQAELNVAKLAIRLKQPDAEKLMLDFVRRYQPDPVANEALLEVAGYYFEEGDLDRSIEYYEMVPRSQLTAAQEAEVNFRLGYAYFVNKDFDTAKRYLQFSRNLQGEFYYPTNYYLGIIQFFEGNYETAARQFEIAEKSPEYAPYIPYYLAQIYFARRQYDTLVTYAAPLLESEGNRLRNRKEIEQLLGQAYFERGQYAEARPLLESYAKGNRRLREEELYQLAFTQYQTQDYDQAARNFRELAGQNSTLGQSANFYLGDIALRQGDGPAARTAFGAASRQNHDPDLQQDALYNYAKLSYELGFPDDAITAIQQLSPGSPYYERGQELLGDVFTTTRDYERALSMLEAMPDRSPKLAAAYQRVAFLRGLELLQQGNEAEAQRLLQASLDTAPNPGYRAQALFWLADLANRRGDYARSIQLTNQFLQLAPGQENLPAQSSVYTANYLQGYNYLKQDDYRTALGYFTRAVEGIERNLDYIQDAEVRERVLGDAVLRAGDAHFARNQYDEAARFYDDAIRRRTIGFVYALYQKALIEGLRGRPAQKVLALERLIESYPNSQFADDALYQLALTYQELNRPQEALEPLRTIVSKYRVSSPLVNQSLLQLGLISYNLGNAEAAINYYKQVFAANPTPGESVRAREALREIYVDDMGRADLFIAFFETLPGQEISTDARDSITYRAAVSQYQNGNYDRAVAALTDYLRQYPRSPNALPAVFFRGDSYVVLKRYNDALPDFEAIVNAGPSRFYLPALKKASLIAYNSLEDFSRAYRLYTQLESAADSEQTRYDAQLGALQSAYRAGDPRGTQTYAQRVADNPNASPEQQTIANFYLAKIAYDAGALDRALPYLEQVIAGSDNERTAEARYLRASIYYRQGQLDRAQQLALDANRESSGYPYWVAKTIILLSDVLRDKQDLYNARAALEALLENYDADAEVVAEARSKLAELERRINSESRLNTEPADPNRLQLDDGRK